MVIYCSALWIIKSGGFTGRTVSDILKSLGKRETNNNINSLANVLDLAVRNHVIFRNKYSDGTIYYTLMEYK